MTITNDVTPSDKASPITSFVITLGKKLLQEKVKDWMDMDGLARFCKTQDIKLDGQLPGTAELETKLRKFFEPVGEFYADDLNVDAYERPKGWDRPFQIRAYPYSPRQKSNLTKVGELDAIVPEPSCND